MSRSGRREMWAPSLPLPTPVVLWPSLLPVELPDLSASFLLSQGSRTPFVPLGLKAASCCCLPFMIPYRFCNLTQRSFNSPLNSPKISAERGFSASEQGADRAQGHWLQNRKCQSESPCAPLHVCANTVTTRDF